MISNNSGWTIGAPKQVMPVMWQQEEDGIVYELTTAMCWTWLNWVSVPCYRHRPIKKEESK